MFNNKNSDYFDQWLLGFTEGDGSFMIIYTQNRWSFRYKISLFLPNIQTLYFFKKNLKAGQVYIDKSRPNMAAYIIQNNTDIENIIIPLFDNYSFLTSKQFQYDKFRTCFNIWKNPSLSDLEKYKKITEIREMKCPPNYKASVWNQFKMNKKQPELHSSLTESFFLEKPKIEEIEKIMTKAWLAGFIEAEGSFYLAKKGPRRIAHYFGLSQKLDPHLLEAMKILFHINARLQYYAKKDYYTVVTSDSKTIQYIIDYFTNKNNKKYFIGLKSLEFQIWGRSFRKYKGDFDRLFKIQKFMRKLRTLEYKLKE